MCVCEHYTVETIGSRMAVRLIVVLAKSCIAVCVCEHYSVETIGSRMAVRLIVVLAKSCIAVCVGEHYSNHQQQAANAENSLDTPGNSSLRRKLFFQGDNGTPISPVK